MKREKQARREVVSRRDYRLRGDETWVAFVPPFSSSDGASEIGGSSGGVPSPDARHPPPFPTPG